MSWCTENSVLLLYSSSHTVWCGDLCKYL